MVTLSNLVKIERNRCGQKGFYFYIQYEILAGLGKYNYFLLSIDVNLAKQQTNNIWIILMDDILALIKTIFSASYITEYKK